MKAILVFNEHNVFALEAGHRASTNLTKEAYLITFLHIKCLL